MLKTSILPVMAATAWISISEFLRNELLLKHVWVEHYASLGLDFPDAPVNGMVWGLWSLLFACGIKTILTRFSLIEGAALAWVMGFVLMWVVTGNMGVLPFSILVYAVPASMLEAFLAAWLIVRLTPKS